VRGLALPCGPVAPKSTPRARAASTIHSAACRRGRGETAPPPPPPSLLLPLSMSLLYTHRERSSLIAKRVRKTFSPSLGGGGAAGRVGWLPPARARGCGGPARSRRPARARRRARLRPAPARPIALNGSTAQLNGSSGTNGSSGRARPELRRASPPLGGCDGPASGPWSAARGRPPAAASSTARRPAA